MLFVLAVVAGWPFLRTVYYSFTDASLADLAARSDTDRPGILLGNALAGQLGVGLGDTVSVLTPQGTLSPLGVVPRTRLVRVAGIFSLGSTEVGELAPRMLAAVR